VLVVDFFVTFRNLLLSLSFHTSEVMHRATQTSSGSHGVSERAQRPVARPRPLKTPTMLSMDHRSPESNKLSTHSALRSSSGPRSPSRLSLSPITRREVEQLYIRGCSPLAVLSSDEISEVLHGVEAMQHAFTRSTPRSTTPGISSSDHTLFSSLSSLPTTATTFVDGTMGGGPHASTPVSSSSICAILKKTDPSSFRRQFALRIGASPATSGCLDNVEHFNHSPIPQSTTEDIRMECRAAVLTEEEALLRERQDLGRGAIEEHQGRERERLCFAFYRRRPRDA
jgi:hypothetical protein